MMKYFYFAIIILGILSCADKVEEKTGTDNDLSELNIDMLTDLFIMEAHLEINDFENIDKRLEDLYKQLSLKYKLSVDDIKNEINKVENNPEAFSQVISALMNIRNEGYRND